MGGVKKKEKTRKSMAALIVTRITRVDLRWLRWSSRPKAMNIFYKDSFTLPISKLMTGNKIYKQLDITLQVLKIFQFLYRYLPLKLNKE